MQKVLVLWDKPPFPHSYRTRHNQWYLWVCKALILWDEPPSPLSHRTRRNSWSYLWGCKTFVLWDEPPWTPTSTADKHSVCYLGRKLLDVTQHPVTCKCGIRKNIRQIPIESYRLNNINQIAIKRHIGQNNIHQIKVRSLIHNSWQMPCFMLGKIWGKWSWMTRTGRN